MGSGSYKKHKNMKNFVICLVQAFFFITLEVPTNTKNRDFRNMVISCGHLSPIVRSYNTGIYARTIGHMMRALVIAGTILSGNIGHSNLLLL